MKKTKIEIILETVEDVYECDLRTKGKNGGGHVSNGKKMYTLLSKELTNYPYSEIGRLIGRKHSNMIHLHKQAVSHKKYELTFRMAYFKCLNKLPQAIRDEGELLKEKITHQQMYDAKEKVKRAFKKYDELLNIQSA